MKETYYAVVLRPAYPGAKQVELCCDEQRHVLRSVRRDAENLKDALQKKNKSATYQVVKIIFGE